MDAHPVLTDMKPRLEAAGRAAADARDAWDAARELRDELVVEAINSGMSYRAVANAARISPPRIAAILLASGVDPDSVEES